MKMHWWGFVGIGVVFGALYMASMPHTAVGYADSDGFLTMGYAGGLMHPPGYSLYILLLNAWMHSMRFLAPAQAGHFLSVILHVATLLFLYGSINTLFGKEKPVWRTLVAVIAVAFLGVNQLFWTNSIVAEKYALNDFLLSLWFWLLILRWQGTKIRPGLVAFVGFITFLYHHTSVLWGVLGVGWLMHERPHLGKIWWRIGVAGVLAVLVYGVTTLYVNSWETRVSWRFEPSFLGWKAQLTRQTLAGWVDVEGVERSVYWFSLSTQKVYEQLERVGPFLWHQQGFGLILVLAGLIVGFGEKNRWWRWLAMASVIVWGGVFVYLPFPSSVGSQVQVMRQWLVGFLVMPLWISLVLMRVAMRWRGVLVGVAGVALVLHAASLWKMMDLSDYSATEDYYGALLTLLPFNAVVYCDTDISCWALFYAREVLGIQPNVTIIPPAYPLVGQEFEKLDLEQFHYPDNPWRFVDIVAWNITRGRRVFAVDLHPTHQNMLGMEYGFSWAMPRGGVVEILTTVPSETQATTLPYRSDLIGDKPQMFDLVRFYPLVNLAYQRAYEARAYARLGDMERAYGVMDEVLALAPPTFVTFSSWTHEFKTSFVRVPPPPLWAAGDYEHEVEVYLAAEENEKAFFHLLGWWLDYPTDARLRLNWARFFRSAGDYAAARREYRNALSLSPTLEEAVLELEALPSSPQTTSRSSGY